MSIKQDSDPFCLILENLLIDLKTKIDETIDEAEKQRETCKKNNELESRVAEEVKLNAELSRRLSQLSRRDSELEQVCASLECNLSISDSDKHRLDNAKEMYQIAKELTGVRWDFTSNLDCAKGYVKSESRKVVQAFSVSAGAGAGGDALWGALAAAAAPAWQLAQLAHHDKENVPV